MKKIFYFVMLSALVLSLPINAQYKGYEKSVEIGYAIGVGESFKAIYIKVGFKF